MISDLIGKQQLKKFIFLTFVLMGLLPALSQNPIVTENLLTGNPSSEWDIDGAGDLTIQGFATDISVNKGETVHFKINTDASAYSINIYRLGYYQGNGARLVGNGVITSTLPQVQPAPLYDDTTGLTDCGNWAESAHWNVPSTAVSGVYLAKLTRSDNLGSSHIVFIVRDDASASDLYFQTSDATWQAYNVYGGNSLYVGSTSYPSGHATKVSYNRPFITRNGGGGGGAAEDWLFNAEYPMIRWLERNGYDVTYTTCVDADRNGSLILNHKVFMSVGHDEYWSGQQRENVETARNAGVHLTFFSGNEIYWKTRWEASTDGSGTPYRTLVCYKEGDLGENACGVKCDPMPTEWTGLWRNGCAYTGTDGCRPENALSGQISWDGTTGSIEVSDAYKNLRFWRNTSVASLTPGTTLTLSDGTLGYEWDWEQYASYYPAGRIRMSNTYLNTHTHHLSLYRHNGGALVFGAGTVQWSWGLDGNHDRGGSVEDATMQQATINLLADMGSQPATIQTGLLSATASTDFTPPVSLITSPTSGIVLTNGSPVTITGTASDNQLVAGIEVSLDSGLTWHAATGTDNWSYTWIPNIAGVVTILTRGVDDSGNLETPTGGVTDTVSPALPVVCPCTVFTVSDTPNVGLANDEQAIELGMKFQTLTSGYITGIRYYKGEGTSGIHTGHLWTNDGTLLTEVEFASETSSGWQQMTLGTPVSINANTTYIVSCFSSSGDYTYSDLFFAGAFIHGPLRALADGEDGSNGVYAYSGEPAFPTNHYNASNYWVDVVFEDSIGTDTIPPSVLAITPLNNATNIGIGTSIIVTFSENIDPSTLSNSSFELLDAGSAVVPSSVSYNAATHKATLTPVSPLLYSTAYTIVVKGGTGYSRIKDMTGNAMEEDFTSTFTTIPVPTPYVADGPGGPILLISSSLNPYSRYPVEILLAEGLNEFKALDITDVDTSVLNNYEVVVLGDISLTSSSVTMLTNWVNNGGTLIAFRPDAQLAPLMGITPAGGTLTDKYLLVNTGTAAGTGIVNQTMQYHGAADLYNLSGATSIATLYNDATTPSVHPAVTLNNVGSAGGQAIAFTYDLARSIVYTRQGNPEWAAQKRDGESGPIRSDDQFYPDWIDLNKVAIPQADEQQHLFANLIISGNLDHKPLPRFWFLPKGLKAAVVMTGDNHGDGGMQPRFDIDLASSTPGCSVNNWECIRSTGYLYVGSTFTDSMAQHYTDLGFEVALHVNTDCENFTPSQYENYVNYQMSSFQTAFPSIPLPSTNRNHCIAWSDWSTTPEVEAAHGIRFDVNYYYWPGAWLADRAGMFTGSGMPMRFAKSDGTIIDCYQATTQMPDESDETFPAFCDALLDKATGPEGYYGVFVTNMHFDVTDHPGANAIVASAKAHNVPVVSAKQMLDWIDARNKASFSSMNWDGNQLNFTVNTDTNARNMKAMLPVHVNGDNLISVSYNGSPITYTTEIIKGIEYAFVPALQGDYNAVYDIAPPLAITSVNVIPHTNGTATITWTTNNLADSQVEYDTSSAALSLSVYNATMLTNHSVVLSGLQAGQTYYYNVTSIDASSGTATEPLAPGTLMFTMPVAYCAQDIDSADYSVGLDSSTVITKMEDGEVILQPKLNQDFNSLTVPGGWNNAVWDAQPGAITTYNGQTATTDGTHLYSDSSFGATTSVEFKATYSTDNFQNVGYTLDADFNAPWIVIGRGAAGDGNVYARTSDGASVSLGSTLLNTPHIYRIERETTTGSFRFYVDGVLIPTPGISMTTTSNLILQVSDYPVSGIGLTVDWLRVLPYDTLGSYISRVFDHGDTTTWENVTWTDSVPTGTSLELYARGGNTSVPDGTWSSFQTLTNGGNLGLTTRFLQYKANFSTSNTLVTPVFKEINFSCSTGSVTCSPPIPYLSAIDSTVCQGHVMQIRLDSATGVAPYSLTINGSTYTNVNTGDTITISAPADLSIWGSSGTPVNSNASDATAIETGVKFRSSVNGFISGVRFYKGTSNNGIHTGSLWSKNGDLLATATFTDETASGWQEVKFNSPVYIFADTTYIASCYSPGGTFAISSSYFASTGYMNPPLAALQAGVDGPNGVYVYGGGFPSNGNNANYWIDVLFMQRQDSNIVSSFVVSDIIDNTGCENSTDSSAFVKITTTSLPAGTISTTGYVCEGQQASLVYNATSGVSPYDIVVNGTTYTGIESGVPFNTGVMVSYGTSMTVWDTTTIPGTITAADNAAIELGMRFRSSVSGKVTGVRFYKGPSNTGVHTGSLWSNSGALLATGTFANETTTGWQEMQFAAPVEIAAGTTYVVSYHTQVGYYSHDGNYFATSGVDNPPLRALQDNEDGNTGIYVYGAGGIFPTDTYNAANYWVDVVFSESNNSFVLSSVSDANGCGSVISTNTVNVTPPEPLVAVVNVKTDVTCKNFANGMAVVSVSGGSGLFTYLWNDILAQTNDTATALDAGIYTVRVIDTGACGDTAFTTVNITEPADTLSFTFASQNISCYGGNNGEASVNPTGGTAPYSFSWSNNSVNDTISNLIFGTYNVTVNDSNGCKLTDSVLINQPALISSTQTLTICSNDSIVVGTHVYSMTGIFTDTLTSANTCDSIVTTDLTVLSANTSSQTLTICSGDSINVGVHFYNLSGIYTDTLAAGSGCDSVITTNLTVLPAITSSQTFTICSGDSINVGVHFYNSSGIYTDTLAAGSGCDSVITTNLTVLPAITSSQTFTICSGDSINVGAHFYNLSGIYTDTLAAGSGCDSVITTNLTVLQQISTDINVSICQNDSVYLGGVWQTSGGIYHDTLASVSGCDSIINTSLTVNPSFFINQFASICTHDSIYIGGAYQHVSGLYYDTLIAITGCDSIIETSLSVGAIDTSVTVIGDTLWANATGTSFQWMDCGTSSIIAGATDSIFSPNESGSYAVIVSEGNCTDTSACHTIVVTGIKNQNETGSISVYPNPVTDFLTIQLKGGMGYNINCKVVDMLGSTVFVDTYNNQDIITINFRKFAAGTYFLYIINEKNITVTKVIKE